MSQGLRWKLIVGCLVLAVLEAPGFVLVFVQDLKGPWKGENGPRNALASAERRDTLLKAPPAEASVDLEELLGRARRDPSGIHPRPVAVLLAR